MASSFPRATPGAYTVEGIVDRNAKRSVQRPVEVTDFPGTLTWRNDNSRSGVNSQELALWLRATSAPPHSANYFLARSTATPTRSRSMCPISRFPEMECTTSFSWPRKMDSVFAFDADANANPCVQLWKTSLIPAGSQAIATPNLNIMSTDIVPFVGITGTPVIDSSASTLYVVAATQTISNESNL